MGWSGSGFVWAGCGVGLDGMGWGGVGWVGLSKIRSEWVDGQKKRIPKKIMRGRRLIGRFSFG